MSEPKPEPQARFNDLPRLPDPLEETDLVWQHLLARFAWYDRAANRHRLAFQVGKTTSLIVAASVPVVAAASAPAPLTATLAAIVVVLEGLQQLFQVQTHYLNYRSTAELLRETAYMYAARVGPYADPATRRNELADFIRRTVGDEGMRWSAAVQQANAKA
ncbi:MAG TPA: DUF4231 domain-containing protein [Actinophytocola sp.]|nr:DUF4231 domain-containing protein [Actinophytocola sp.]